LGAQVDVKTDTGWTAPFPLWMGVLAGPVAFALDLGVSYAIVKWSCSVRSHTVLHAITVLALAMVLAGAVAAGMALRATRNDVPTDGGSPRQRARFMAVLGLSACALFALAIFAEAIPRWVLDACL
jgi:hypothetical protein